METRKHSLSASLLILWSIISILPCKSDARDIKENKAPGESNNKLDWFHEAKFGLFIHWGLYAVPAGAWEGKTGYGEWIQYGAGIPGAVYEKFASQFNPSNFNAEEWVSVAKNAGMKYIVITSKHHEGFCMYDSKLTDYDIVDATPYKKDPMKELAAECRRQGIKLCFYYSVKDWHHENYPIEYTYFSKAHPDGFLGFPEKNKPDYRKYFSYMQDQVKELLTNYGPVGIIWFDWYGSALNPGQTENRAMAKQLVDSIHKWQPSCLINNRLGGIGADYGTPEQEIPDGVQKQAFEVCMTLNNHWGYNKNDNNWKRTDEVIYNICDIASKGGNYLLNIGPTALGEFPEKSKEILKGVGKWMQMNGEAIYNTTSSRVSVRWNPDVEMITRKPGTYYLHIFKYPEDNRVYLNDFKENVKTVYFLADKEKQPLKFDIHPEGIMIHVPDEPVDEINTVIVVKY
ncbi:MAG: alpha-L-fucosidase [Cytophagales bacterium]|nr:alpha-L-fucosidase [Cytophagales bacterium]